MKILMINKYLYEKGGAETYCLQIGSYLESIGHKVQYFGMDYKDRCVTNHAEQYVSEIDFHHAAFSEKIAYPFRIIYSSEAARKLLIVLNDFQPDVCHINNFNFQLTPSILVTLKRWNSSRPVKCRIIYTAHDPQFVCPNHMMMNPGTHQICEKCLTGNYVNCIKGKCIHDRLLRSCIGTLESVYWHHRNIYSVIDTIICCSAFLKTKLDTDPVLRGKTLVLHNYIRHPEDGLAANDSPRVCSGRYILFFGRLSEEKGIRLLLQAISDLQDITLVIAGSGPLADLASDIPNVRWIGFQSGEYLCKIIREAEFTICPSVWYENCPFSVLESISLGTPVLGAAIGGIPELIIDGENGLLFKALDADDLKIKIRKMWDNPGQLQIFRTNNLHSELDTIEVYCEKLLKLYIPEKELQV